MRLGLSMCHGEGLTGLVAMVTSISIMVVCATITSRKALVVNCAPTRLSSDLVLAKNKWSSMTISSGLEGENR